MHLRFRLASRYAFSRQNRHRRSSVRIALGLALCLLAIVAVLSFMQALQTNLFTDIRNLESFDLQYTNASSSLAEARAIAEDMGTYSGVEAAFVWAEMPVVIQSESGATFSVRLRALDLSDRHRGIIHPYMGSLFDDGAIAIAYTNAHLVPPTKEVKLTFLRSGKQAAVVPATRVVPVSGIYYTSSWEFDSTTLLTTLETVQSLIGMVNYHVGLYSNTAPMSVKRQLKNAGYPEIKTYHEANAALWAAMELEQKLMVVMLLVMVVIVLVHAYSSTRRLVATKQREVAMLMTLGVPKRTITEVFILQAAIISSLGLALGVGLSYGLLALYPHLAPILYRHIGTYLVLTIQVGQLLLLIGGIFTFSLLVAYWAIRRLLSVDIMEMFVYDETT